MSPKKLVLVINKHPITSKAVSRLVERSELNAEVITADSAVTMLNAVQDKPVDIIITDVGAGTLEAIKQVISLRPSVNILVMGGDEELWALRSIRAGAKGFISLIAPVDELASSIARVAAGKVHVSAAISQKLASLTGRNHRFQLVTGDPLAYLSDKELDVFQLIGQGLPTRMIALKLGISTKTVESHRSHIKTKLNLEDAAALVASAITYSRSR